MSLSDKLRANWPLVAAAVAATAVAGVGIYYLLSSEPEEEEVSSPVEESPTQSSKQPVVAAEPATVKSAAKATVPTTKSAAAPASEVTKTQLVQILNMMISKLSELKGKIDGEREAMLGQGNSPEEVEEAMQYALQEGLQSVEEEIAASMNVDQKAVMVAQQRYAGEPEIAPLVEQLKEMFFGSEQVEEMKAAAAVVPADMTAQDFLVKLKKHVAVVDSKLESILAKAARETRNNGTSAAEREMYADMLVMRDLDAITGAALQAADLSEAVWKGCLVKFGSDPAVIEELMASHARQGEAKRKHLGSN